MAKFHDKQHEEHVRLIPMLKGVVGMLRNPEGTMSIYDIEEGLLDLEATNMVEEHAKSHPDAAAIVEERYLASKTPDLNVLGTLAEGTLGKAFWHHIEDHGFDPDYFKKMEVETDRDYVLMRVRQTHDLWHVVLGIGPSRIGELAIKAFELAQLRRPMAAVLVSGGIMRCMTKDPDRLADLLDAIHFGYSKGEQCKPFLAQKWELGWDKPLDEWRAEIGLDLSDVTPALKKSFAYDADAEWHE